MSKYVDYINVMTYDFVTGYDAVLGFNAPLKGQGANNVEASIKYWLNQGKIFLFFPKHLKAYGFFCF